MKKTSSLWVMALACASQLMSNGTPESNAKQGILSNITEDNDLFVQGRTKEDFEKMFDGQHPRVVIVGCADSRFHSNALDATPENDLFFIRNIGNQYSSNRGSVMYAVNHLNVPVVLIVGHDSCGAVTAATTGISKLEKDVQKELKDLHLPIHCDKPTAEHIHENVEANVCSQVAAVMKDFKDKVSQGKLDVMGAVYDFKNEYGQGYGALIFVNWNGERDHAKIAAKAKEFGLNKIKVG